MEIMRRDEEEIEERSSKKPIKKEREREKEPQRERERQRREREKEGDT